MEKAGGTRASELVRRTAPLKVMIGLLYRELEGSKGDAPVAVDRALFESVITTLECVVEDVESRAPKADERRLPGSGEMARAATPRT